MKKLLIVLFIMLAICFCGCSSKSAETNQNFVENTTKKSVETIEISENAFVSKINEIYTNTDSYLGKNIVIEGCFAKQNYDNKTYYYVYRTGPGCCGNDGAMCGFEFTSQEKMPKDNDWIRVEGELNKYEENGQTYLTIKANSVDVLTQRGMATVS